MKDQPPTHPPQSAKAGRLVPFLPAFYSILYARTTGSSSHRASDLLLASEYGSHPNKLESSPSAEFSLRSDGSHPASSSRAVS